MKILIVNYFFAPTIDAHAYRWTQISQHWAECGFDVEVITGKVKGLPASSVESGVKVRRVGLINNSNNVGVDLTKYSAFNRMKNSIINFLRPLYRKIYWPDALWHWFPYVFLEILYRRKSEYDVVISYYPCFSAHLAVRILKKISRHAQFKWVLDYGDPFCASESWQPNNYAIYGRLNRFLEKNFSNHGSLIFTNLETAEAYKARLNSLHGFGVIPHLVNVRNFHSEAGHQVKAKSSEIQICYIGAFHPNIREPHRLIDLVKKMLSEYGMDIRLSMYGSTGGYDLSPADYPSIRHYGYIEREKAIEIIKSADFIVNVDNENCVMTPSKIVECIATGRPVINISNPDINYPPMDDYIEIGYAISITNTEITEFDAQEVSKFINKHIGTCEAPASVINSILSDHLLEVVAHRYLK